MKTKLLSLAIILLLTAPMAIGQTAEKSRTSLGILGGANFMNLTGKDHSGDKLSNDLLVGYHAGINIQIPLVRQFFFQPGLLFSTKGAKNTSGSVTSTTRISYFEMPLNFVYKGKLGNGYVLLGFGPYIGYGVGGKVTVTGGDLSYNGDVVFQNSVELSDPILDTYVKSFDAGGNIFAGYEMAGGLFFQFNTQLGMLKINPENAWFSNDEASVKHTGFGLSLGYRF